MRPDGESGGEPLSESLEPDEAKESDERREVCGAETERVCVVWSGVARWQTM